MYECKYLLKNEWTYEEYPASMSHLHASIKFINSEQLITEREKIKNK